MRLDHSPDRNGPGYLCAALALMGVLHGCAAPAGHAVEPRTIAPPPIIVPAAPDCVRAPAPAEPDAAAIVLAYADRVRGLQPAELAQEIGRLGDPGDSPTRAMQLAIALWQSKGAVGNQRAQALLQRVLGQNEQEARALHPLARLVASQLAEARRAEEQLDRQNQQLRDTQRRIEQLSERLEAVRAIERSLPSRPAAGASAPASAQVPVRP